MPALAEIAGFGESLRADTPTGLGIGLSGFRPPMPLILRVEIVGSVALPTGWRAHSPASRRDLGGAARKPTRRSPDRGSVQVLAPAYLMARRRMSITLLLPVL